MLVEALVAALAEASGAEVLVVEYFGETDWTAAIVAFVVLLVAELAAGSHHHRKHSAAALATALSGC